MTRFHSTYKALEYLVPESIDYVTFSLIGNYRGRSKIIKFLFIFIDYIYVVLRLFFSHCDLILVREYHTRALWVFKIIATFQKNKTVFLVVNHNIRNKEDYKNTQESLPKNLSLIMFDYEIPFPYIFHELPGQKFKLENKGEIRVGVLGAYRKEKRIEDVLEEIERVILEDHDCKFVLASNKNILTPEQSLKIQYIDTSSKNDYEYALDVIDICILPYGADYEFRTSGVVYDLIAKDIPIICTKDTLIISSLINNNKLGVVIASYANLVTEINNLVSEINLYKENIIKFKIYRNENIQRLYNKFFLKEEK